MALAEMGEFALPAVTARLFDDSGASVKRRAAESLARTAAKLAPTPRARLRRNLDAALGLANEPDVAAAIGRALAAVEAGQADEGA